MMQIIQINFLLYTVEAGKNRVGSKQKRDRDKQIKGVREGAQERIQKQ